jgi:hypothetical protein
MTDANDTFYFTGDRAELEAWLAVTKWAVARGITMDDGSLLLYRDDRPYSSQAWTSVAPEQTLVRKDDTLRASSATASVAASISGLVMGAWTIHTELHDAEANRLTQDYARRWEMLAKASATATKLVTDIHALQSGVAYDNH